jgi:hypothetical protein
MTKLFCFCLISFASLTFAQNYPTAPKPGAYSKTIAARFASEGQMEVRPGSAPSEKTFLFFGEKRTPRDFIFPIAFKAGLKDATASIVRQDKNVFIDQTEIANIQYKEFLYYINKDSFMSTFEQMKPVLSEEQYDNYFLNPNHHFSPVFGISHPQANSFCRWRAAVLNGALNDAGIFNLTFVGRLPRESEWMSVATEAKNLIKPIAYKLTPADILYLKQVRPTDLSVFNFKEGTVLNALTANLKGDNTLREPMYVYSHVATNRPIYHLIGNVAEWTAEGYLKGGDLTTSLTDDIVTKRFEENDILFKGFRCVCELVKQ